MHVFATNQKVCGGLECRQNTEGSVDHTLHYASDEKPVLPKSDNGGIIRSNNNHFFQMFKIIVSFVMKPIPKIH